MASLNKDLLESAYFFQEHPETIIGVLKPILSGLNLYD